jgi:hypothetical protein
MKKFHAPGRDRDSGRETGLEKNHKGSSTLMNPQFEEL